MNAFRLTRTHTRAHDFIHANAHFIPCGLYITINHNIGHITVKHKNIHIHINQRTIMCMCVLIANPINAIHSDDDTIDHTMGWLTLN